MSIIPLEARTEYSQENTYLNPQAMENYVRHELVIALAQQLISEDMVQIYTDYDIKTARTIVRAKIKIIQGE